MALNNVVSSLSDKAYIQELERIINTLQQTQANLISRVSALEKRK
jgi:hypothetical protein